MYVYNSLALFSLFFVLPYSSSCLFLFYLIILYYVSLDVCLLTRERLGKEGRWEELGRVGGQTGIRILYGNLLSIKE